MNPIDGQALLRRLKVKQRDGGVEGVILLMRDTRQSRAFRREFADQLAAEFPVRGRRALELLTSGAAPGGNAIIPVSGSNVNVPGRLLRGQRTCR